MFKELKTARILLITIGFATLTMTGCGKQQSSSVSDSTSDSELAEASLSGPITASDGIGTQASHDVLKKTSLLASLKANLNPFPEALASTACATLAVGGTGCSTSGNIATLNYSACTFGNPYVTWTGDQYLNFSAASPSCGSFPATNGGSLTRTFLPGTTRTAQSGTVVTLDTTDATGYSTPVSGGATIVYNNATQRTITINGINLVGSVGNFEVWNHSVSSSGITVGISGSTRTVSSGTVTVQHNLAKYTATASLSNLSYTTACCTPVSGSIATTFSGSRSGTETLTFNSCGSATLANSAGSSNITLYHCF